ncbi:MAG: penicillin acylase family protein [Candidatus Kapaibacteriota bacterium]
MQNQFGKINLLISIFVIIVSLALFIIFAFQISKVSIAEEPFFGKSSKLQQKVQIFKNQYGIPHIIAEDLNDAMFGVGFVQASDRLWQMDYLRRVASGELAEILGPQAIKFDQYFRALQLRTYSELVVKNLDPFSLKLLNAFSNGVNYYIETHWKKLPVEFQALNYKPRPWTPLDCILIGRLMAFTMNFSFWMDLTYFDIANKIGYQKASELIPTKVETIDFLLSDTMQLKPKIVDTLRADLLHSEDNFSKIVANIQHFFPYIFQNFGSNTWAVQRPANQKRKAILASDPHLKLALPPIWYQIHITTTQTNSIGLCLPGVPLPLIGRNDYISWGITNGMLDDCDFFIHRIDSTGKFVLDSTKKIRIVFKTDTIKVKNSNPFVYYQRFIGNDVIISDFLLLKDTSVSASFYGIKHSPQFPKSFGLTFKWTGKAITNEVLGLFKICTAKNWNQFLEAKKYWGVPALNFSYADIYGNVGLMLAGIVPIRQNINPNFPTLSNGVNTNWIGVQKLGNDFSIFNPPEGFVFNSNNKTFSSTFHLSNYWSDPSRATRVYLFLLKNQPEVPLNIEVMQTDKVSEQASFVLKRVIPILERHSSSYNKIESKALEKLRNWNCIFSERFVAPSIYQFFLVKFLENTLKDELGESLFNQFMYLDFMAMRMFLELLADSSSQFFDNLNTPHKESKEEIILKSFLDAVKYLQKTFGDNVDGWNYGKWHKLKIGHPFSIINFLDPSFSFDETSIGGHNSTINYAGGKLFSPEKVEVGPSARFIADMSDSVVYWILPGGNSGQNMSKNYSDQYQLWLNGGYISTSISKVPDARFKLFANIEAK